MKTLPPAAKAIIQGQHCDPFGYLGLHEESGKPVVRAFFPDAMQVCVLQDNWKIDLPRVDDAGLFAGPVAKADPHYRLRVQFKSGSAEFEDAYRFPPILGDLDLHLLTQGTHLDMHRKLGAHPMTLDGVAGVAFVVFAPNARRVSVVGDFNHWDGRRHAMRVRGPGFWEIFVPSAAVGDNYKFEIISEQGVLLPLKADPLAFASRVRPDTASVVFDMGCLRPITPAPAGANNRDRPISIYEVHLGSWRRQPDQGNRWLTYRELAEELPRYAADMGFTHIELLPVMEHPFDGSWGYQPIGLFSPTSRFGTPADFLHFVEACHEAGLAVILDWVPGHFPDDPHGLQNFSGHAVYEHADPRQGRHLDWGTLIYNYGRVEVSNFLFTNALFWLDRYGIDGLRVDAVASMLYLDYSRPQGEWVPNRFGGRENLEAVEFLKRLNREVFGRFPNATTMAEESTAWPQVSRPLESGGLGFGYKWNMGWMHDTLQYIGREPVHRKYHHNEISFGLHYAFSENFVLPLSHDEVVHGKGSILGRMPGDDWQKFANLRAFYGMMFGHPGKKLLFMGNEFGQVAEWNHDRSLDWHLLDQERHAGVQTLIRDLNRLYGGCPALHERDCVPEGFEWIVGGDVQQSVFVWLRRGHDPESLCVMATNFTSEIRRGYTFAVPRGGRWREVLNTDSAYYGGSNVGNAGEISAQPSEGQATLTVDLPPLATIFLVPAE